jgi:hypothetical protein
MANKKTRVASLSLATKNEETDQYEYDDFGVLLADLEGYPGSASAIIEINTGKETDEGYPERAKLVACKFLAPDGEEILVDVTESFINLTFWHAVERSPKAKTKA